MLVWWILSLVILISCFIFAYRMIVSSYEFLPSDKRYFLGFYKNPGLHDARTAQRDKQQVLNKKARPAKDNSAFLEIQFSKFQDRLVALEELNTSKSSPGKITIAVQADEEDWKEMYYEENTVKEKLENDLDYARQMLEDAENKLKDSTETNTRWVTLQSEYDARLNDLQSLQDHISLLKRQLEAGAGREKELEQLLLSEITLREKYTLLQREHVELQSEADNLRRRIAELYKKDINIQKRVARLNELESKMAICEGEKIRLKTNLEKLL